ncbi:MAG: hypothetical protein Q9170_001169 [Blastenia crenularia]
MAFRFGSPGVSALGNNAGGSVNLGPELEEIQTESISGDAKVRLLPSPWPADALPTPTASLLSVASRNGLLAAAGPTSVVIASTEAVRRSFASKGADGNVKPFTPQLTLELSMRISQVAFSSDEKFLILSAEHGGGLAVYEVQSLAQGNTQSAFQISTNNTSLRMLSPNPTPEKAELLAVVTTQGDLLMANLALREFVNGPQGIKLKEGVSCVSWSARGKQLIAGLGDGSCYQLTPEGEGKAIIPPPPDLEVDQHVSAIFWLENELFMVAHTTTSGDEDMIPATTFRVVTRQSKPQISHAFQKLPDPTTPFGMKRSPPHHFMQRLRNFPPSLSDLIVVTNTASTDVGLFTRADTALTSDAEVEKVTKVFTTTTMADDARRAQLPMADDTSDTSPIGMAIDLSPTEKVPKPLGPNEEMDQSSGPLPLLMILNNEGLLISWWIVYSESIRQGTTYPGLVAAEGFRAQAQTQTAKSASPFATPATQPAPSPFTSNAFGSPSAQNGAFSNPTASNAFGGTGSNSAFGVSSTLGSKPSFWGSGSAAGDTTQNSGASFGKPSFGSSTQIGGSFGAPGGFGSRPSPWGAPSSVSQTVGSTFGQTANLGMNAGSAFGSSNMSKPVSADSSGGFANFAQRPGFAAAAAAAKPSGASPFGKAGEGASFGSGMDTDTVFGAPPQKPEGTSSRLFGGGAAGSQFKLGSTFKGDDTSSTDAPKPAAPTNNSLFGGGFADSLGETPKQTIPPISQEADMTEDGSESEREAMSEASEDDQASATPATQQRASLFDFPQTAPPVHGVLFGTQAQSKTTPAMVQKSTPAAIPSGKPAPISTTPEDTPRKSDDTVRPSIETTPLSIKTEPQDDSPSGISRDVPEGPLPPDTTSKDSYSPGDTSQSSTAGSKVASNDAPLPPDFLPSKADRKSPEPGPGEESALPEDDDSGLDDEGSGIDVAQEISPITDPTRTPKITPGSSFGALIDKSPEGLFTRKGQSDTPVQPKALFGEVLDKSSKLYFPPPSRTQESPRSPSPVRPFLAVDGLRPENARSISAPNAAAKTFSGRKFGPQSSNPLAEPQPSIQDLQTREQERLHAQRVKQVAEDSEDICDPQDDEINALLNSELEPTTELAGFIANEDFHPRESKPGLPGQIETLFRDINSMIDTIGLNARNLGAFVRGHSEHHTEGRRSIGDLEESGWCLGEIDDLMGIENKVLEHVDDGRVSEPMGKLADCEDLRKDLKKLHDRQREISTILMSRSDQQQGEHLRYAQLPVDQVVKQKELRSAFKHLQELTADAESKVFELRADLASQETNNNGRLKKKPTVEAVVNTIQKMTNMIQQRSSDIDVLEAQMRKLRLPTETSNGSRESSPSAASASLTRSNQTDVLSKSMGALRLSVNGNGTPSKRTAQITPDQISRYQAKVQRRKEMNGLAASLSGERRDYEKIFSTRGRLRPFQYNLDPDSDLVLEALWICRYLKRARIRLWRHILDPRQDLGAGTTSQIPVAYVTWNDSLSQWLLALHQHYDSDVVRISPHDLSLYFPIRVERYIPKPQSRIRRLLTHVFSDKALREQEPLIQDYVDTLIERLSEQCKDSEGKVDLASRFNWTTFDVIGDLAFGEPFDCLKETTYQPWVRIITDNLRSVVLTSVTMRFPPLDKLVAMLIPQKLKQARIDHYKKSQEKANRRLLGHSNFAA